MNSGGPGDHWSTDIFRWNLPAFGEPSDTLIREHWGQRDGPWVPGDLQDRGVRVQAVTSWLASSPTSSRAPIPQSCPRRPVTLARAHR